MRGLKEASKSLAWLQFTTFVCDKCLIKIEDFVEVETLLDIYGVEYEDTKDYNFKFCPECGRKVVE